jgi:HEPN domain-containing protein
MNSVVKEWIAKAQEDFAVASRELRVGRTRSNNAICFHAQQCVEKLMKALLIQLGEHAPKTHDLLALDGLLSARDPSWSASAAELRLLNQGAVEFRYPGDGADAAAAREAMKYARRLHKALLSRLSA